MVEFQRPSTYLEKLEFAQRVVRAASFRSDQRQGVRELCEAMSELIVALIERGQGQLGASSPNSAPKTPAS